MCAPAIPLALTVASSAADLYAQDKAADKQTSALAEQRAAQREELRAKATTEAGERVKQARAERSRLRVAAGEAGITGQSFEAQLFDSYLQEDLDIGLLAKDSEFADRASHARYRSGLAGVSRPDYLAAGLQIATSAHGLKTGKKQ